MQMLGFVYQVSMVSEDFFSFGYLPRGQRIPDQQGYPTAA